MLCIRRVRIFIKGEVWNANVFQRADLKKWFDDILGIDGEAEIVLLNLYYSGLFYSVKGAESTSHFTGFSRRIWIPVVEDNW
jgi:hypothetical protein